MPGTVLQCIKDGAVVQSMPLTARATLFGR